MALRDFADLAAQATSACFEHLGDAASWTSVNGGPVYDAVRVEFTQPDEILDYGSQSRAVAGARLIQVQKAEVPSPGEGDVCTLARDGRQLRIIARPVLDESGLVWSCEAADV